MIAIELFDTMVAGAVKEQIPSIGRISKEQILNELLSLESTWVEVNGDRINVDLIEWANSRDNWNLLFR